jgi:predicted 3-demethylubiquinone-9 3-methyltransferase (glyoxalase superfamily)
MSFQPAGRRKRRGIDQGGNVQKITTFLTYDGRAEEAAELYTSVFENARIVDKNYYGEAMPDKAGSVMTVTFEIEGQQFVALNAEGFSFAQGISLMVSCETQAEVDALWEQLAADGGEHGPCGWLEDKFGVSWQIVPRQLGELLSDPDREKANRVMSAMLGMRKIEIAGLEEAAEGAHVAQ